jgi:hypothetical protein
VAYTHYSYEDLLGSGATSNYGSLFAYGVGLADAFKMPVNIDLAQKRFKQELRLAKEIIEKSVSPKVVVRSAAIGLTLVALFTSINLIKVSSLNASAARLKKTGPNSSNLSDSEIKKMISIFENKISAIEEAVGERNVASRLFAIPGLLPEGLWLTGLSLKMDSPAGKVIDLKGIAYLADPNAELNQINNFIMRLRKSPQLSKEFKTFSLVSAAANQASEFGGTSFEIVCK